MVEKIDSTQLKDPSIALLLGLVPAFFMFAGLGHFYIGNIRKGLILLLVGWALGFVNVIGIFLVVTLCVTVPLTLVFIGYNAYDAYEQARMNNELLRAGKRPPWKKIDY
ncbi:hypothetical protein FJZ26_01375 [Candidatus Parvarchaeota archaeon]|nr:hypothetical protein [Candidatus Parvarchaeota archaeon]